MEQNIFNTAIILIGSQNALMDINGPSGIGSTDHKPGGPSTPTVETQTVPAEVAEGTPEEGLTPEEKKALEAEHKRLIFNDPNQDPQSRKSLNEAQERIQWFNAVLGKKIDRQNLLKAKNAAEAARELFEANANGKDLEKVLTRLRDIHSSLPMGADKRFVAKVIKETEARANANGVSVKIASAEGPEVTTHAQYIARKNELNLLSGQLGEVLSDLLPPDVAAKLRKVDFLGLDARRDVEKGIVAKFDSQIESLKKDLDQARHLGDAARIKHVDAKIKSLQDQKEVALRKARLVLKVLEAADRVKGGTLQQLNQFFEVVRAQHNGLQIESALLSFSSDKEIDLNKIGEIETRAMDLDIEEATPRSRTADAGEVASEPKSDATMGTSSATASGQASSDEAVEAVEAVKKVRGEEEGQGVPAGGDQPTLGIQSAETHAEIQSDWQGLTDNQMAMKIASSGVVMGITSSYFDARSKERKIRDVLQKLIKSIEAGNLDAIGTALIMIAHRSKYELRKAALMVIQTMEYNQKKLQENNKILADLTEEKPDTFAADLQRLSQEANMVNTDNQAAISMLRQIKATSDEFDNITKSWLDVQGSHQRALARFTA